MRRVNPEVDGQVGDALVGAGDAVGLVLDLLHDLVEVGELLALAVQELSILVGRVDELEDEGTAGHDARASGKEIPRKQGRKRNLAKTELELGEKKTSKNFYCGSNFNLEICKPLMISVLLWVLSVGEIRLSLVHQLSERDP